MKRVAKQVEPAAFTDWKSKTSEAWQPRYGALQKPEKQALHAALLTEQGWVCCYCGRSISLLDSHIEHFRPQDAREDLALDYGNLHASCIRETEPGAPLHCGHTKGNDFDESCAISPQDTNCEHRFSYSAQDGTIYPSTMGDECAAYMVGLLKLDVKFLCNRRAEALKDVFDDAFVRSASDNDLVKLAHAYRVPDARGNLTGFGHALARYAEQLLRHTQGPTHRLPGGRQFS